MTNFTIVIPTRERADTLFWTLKTCLEQNYPHFEIIVSDNAGTDNTKDVVDSFSSDKIRYYNTGSRLSMTANFEFGLSKVKSGFVCFLGDDDALLPHSLNALDELIRLNKTKALAWSPATYIWKSVEDKTIAGRLKIPFKNTFHSLNGADILKTSANDVFSSIRMPSPYWSFVDIELIRAVYRENKFFHSFIPDTYAGAMLASVCGNYIYSNRPFSVSGSSHHSNALGFFNKKINRESNERFLKENDLKIHPKIEIGPSAALLLAEPLLQAYDRLEGGIKLDMLKALDAALWEAAHCGDEEIYSIIREKVVLSAAACGLKKEISHIAAKTKFKGIQNKKSGGTTATDTDLFIDTLALDKQGFSVSNVYDAARFVNGMLKEELPVQETDAKPAKKERGKYNAIRKKINEILFK